MDNLYNALFATLERLNWLYGRGNLQELDINKIANDMGGRP